jgi:L-lactate dehydrogenase (cytochrome)
MKPMDAISGNLKKKAQFGPQMMRHLSWLTSFKADGGAMKFANVILDDGSTMPYADIGAQLRQSAVTWEDVKWIKQAWGDRPIIIKGVHNVNDARLAEQHGASAIVISNHGGRQLDRVLPTLHILKVVAPRLQAEHSTMEILMDGGVRSGSDVVIARVLGAKAVLVGRAYAYGLGAGGEAGVKRAFDILRKEIDDTMRQLGCAKLDDLEPSKHLRPYPFSEAGAGLVRVGTSFSA